MSPVVVAAIIAVAIAALIVGSNFLRDIVSQRNQLVREQKAREDAAAAANRARDYYERDLNLVASVFDPLGLFH